MALDIKVDYEVVMHTFQNSFFQRWYFFPTVISPIENKHENVIPAKRKEKLFHPHGIPRVQSGRSLSMVYSQLKSTG